MAHYALLDPNNIVVQVFVGRDDDDLPDGATDWETYYSPAGFTCKQTSYNNRIRKQYAGIGYTYDPIADVFIRPQPYPSWTLDDNHDWQAPTPCPTDGHWYTWDETTQTWTPA